MDILLDHLLELLVLEVSLPRCVVVDGKGVGLGEIRVVAVECIVWIQHPLWRYTDTPA